MALFRKLFYWKPPDGLLEISERVYVFDYCFTTDAWGEKNYKGYVGGIIAELRDHYPDASILLFNFREGNTQSMIANALSEYDMTIMEYPRHYEGCPLLPMEVIHHFLRSGESWLSLGLQNVLLMHCERGGWPVLAFMLAALLIYRKQYTGEFKTLEMVYKQAPRELLHLLSPLNPMPSQLRYLQYISRRNVASEWPPLDRALTIECVIIRMIPNFGAGGCRPIFRIYGQDPFLVSDRAPKVLFSTSKKSRTVRHYKQAECELVKIDINCHIQGDVVLECISLHDDMEREEMMFRAMFNTAFIRSNILMLNRDEIDLLWDAKDRFPKEFRAEVLFSEMDAATSIEPQDFPFFEEKDGLPVEAFARVQEIFSSVDWVVPKNDSAAEVNQHTGVPLDTVVEAYSDAEKLHKIQTAAALEYIKSSMDLSPQIKRSSPQSMPTTPTLTKKNTDPGQPRETSFSPVTPSLQDKASIQHGSPELHLQPEILSATTLTLNNDIAVRQSISIHSAQSPVSCDIAVREGQSKSKFNPAVSSSTEAVVEGSGIVPSSVQSPDNPGIVTVKEPPEPGLLPSAPSPTEGIVRGAGVAQSSVSSDNIVGEGHLEPAVSPLSSTEDIVKGARTPFSSDVVVGKGTSKPAITPPAQSSTARVVKGSSAALPPSKHYSSTVDVVDSTRDGHLLRDEPSEGRLLQIPHLSHDSSSTADTTYKAGSSVCTPPSTTSLLKENSADKDGTQTPSPLSCTPPLPNVSARRPIPSPPPPPSVPLNENSSAQTGTCPPPPPPPPPTLTSRFEEHSASGISVHPPPPPPPLPPASINIKVARPPPPPPPVRTPSENSSIKLAPPPPPPPPLTSRHGDGVINPSPVLPPPPPPAPAGPPRPSINCPPVPSAPPPPLPSHKGNANSSNARSSSLFVSPSPPPPSAPPTGAKGKGLLSRSVSSRTNPDKKLKPLHWLKITRAVSGSLWAEAQKSGEASKAPEIDMSELESLFSTATSSSDQGISGRKAGLRASMVNKPEKVQLVDHRRAYNCEIMLSKVKTPLHELLTSVLALEDTAMDIDQVENVIKFCPTKEEMELLKGYKGEKEKLGKCEQFFLELMQVPRVESKLRVFSFKIQFSSQVSDLRNSLSIVNSAADQIRGSAKLKRIMQTILSLGNALNQGTARGSAIGFRLDSLLKLTETRAMNNKMTLMHYLCKVLADKLPELLDFWEDLSSLERASKIQLKYLAEEMQAINKGLEKIVQELSMSENDGPVSDQFRKALKEFLRFSESEVRSLASLYSGVGRNVDALILYFGEDPARCPFEQVISTLLNFVRMFKKAHEENCKQLELDKKKAEKEASADRLKINASDAGKVLQSSVRSVK